MRALEVIQLSLMLKRIDPKIAGILFPCLNSDIKNVKIIGLSVTGMLGINNPKFLSVICNMVNDKDLEVRESAFNTLRLINAQGPQFETLIPLAIANENNETVFKEILKFIEGTELKSKAIQKALQKSSKKPHDKENQQLIKNLLESFDLEGDNLAISKSPQSPTAPEVDPRKSAASQSTIKHSNASNFISLEKANFIQEVLLANDNTKPDSFLKPSGHIFAKTEVFQVNDRYHLN
ncbi:Protein of unknown function [Gryllus bimaculatus]|nr:Protein of unknown function [Gryllus bimaculatus]